MNKSTIIDTSDIPTGFVNTFRKRRGLFLSIIITKLATYYKRPIKILDLGGNVFYWQNIDLSNISNITIQNLKSNTIEQSRRYVGDTEVFHFEVGDATNLREYHDQSIDLIHSNSVIEHVGRWPVMWRMAKEVRRVGRAGWIQTPAWEFPIEIHSKLPFVHWFGNPIRTSALVAKKRWRHASYHHRRSYVDDINMVTYREMQVLFPDLDILIERFLLFPKSYTVYWLPIPTEQE